MSSRARRTAGAFDALLAGLLIVFVIVALAATNRYRPIVAPANPALGFAQLHRAPSDVSTLTVDSIASGGMRAPAPPAGTPVRIRAGRSAVVAGWAVSDRDRSPAGGVIAVIDGTTHVLASYGLPRPDVATTLRSPALRDSGFEVTLPGIDLRAGTHVVRFDVVSLDGTAYSEVSARLDIVATN